MLTKEDAALMREYLSFWDKLTPQEQQLLIENTACVTYDAGENIHCGDVDCVGVLLIKSGELRSYILSEEGREVTLYRLTAGDVCILSASCILKNVTFDVHIDAEKNSEVLLISATVFQEICLNNVYAENFSYKMTTEKFSEVMWAMEQILFMSLDKRLAVLLLDEIAKTKSDTILLTHDKLAKYMGSAREAVSRMLKYFEREGMVTLSRGGITITDKQKLRRLL